MAAVLAAREAGAAQIVAIGLTRDHHRFEVARRFGATHTINLDVEDPVRRVHQLTAGALADMVMDLTAPPVPRHCHSSLCVRWVLLYWVQTRGGVGSAGYRKIAAKEIRYQGVNTHDTPACVLPSNSSNLAVILLKRWLRITLDWRKRKLRCAPQGERFVWTDS